MKKCTLEDCSPGDEISFFKDGQKRKIYKGVYSEVDGKKVKLFSGWVYFDSFFKAFFPVEVDATIYKEEK